MRNSRSSVVRSLFVLVGSVSVLGCSSTKDNADTKGTSGDAAVVAKAGSASPSAEPTSSSQPAGLSADADGSLAFAWKVVKAAHPRVTVSAVVGSETLALGSLDATSDSEDNGSVDSCYMKNAAQTSTLHCGGSPAYNYLTASIREGSLVITLTQGVVEGRIRRK